MQQDAIAQRIGELLAGLQPQLLEITNFSHQHSRGDTSHYKITMVSQSFADQPNLARHRQVYARLGELMPEPVHALMLELFSPQEWSGHTAQPAQPPACQGGAK